ncbi:TPA: helix-turn-helix domain-containing protein [Streptococcus agalactiae]
MLGENIYLQRTQIGMTQENLSDYLHLTKTTISKWENNQAKPDIDYLILMANLFDISLDDLVGYQKTLSDDQRNQLIKDLKIKANVLSERDFFQEVKELSKQFPNDFKTLLIMINMVLSNLTNLNDSEMKEWSLSTLNKIISKTVVESDLQTAIMFKTVVLFHNLEYDEVINLYQNSPYKLGEELLLANSFFAKGDVYRAKQVLQVEIYQQILLVCEYLLSLSTFEVEENKGDIFERLEHMIEAFQLNSLHPNTVIKCYYSLACHYSKSDDDNFEDLEIKTYRRFSGDKGTFSPPKTKTSIRTIPISQSLALTLRRLKDDQQVMLKNLKIVNINNQIFYDYRYGVSSNSAINKSLRNVLHLLNIDSKMTAIGARHTYGSYLLAKGVDIWVVARLMGHKDITQLLETYGHVLTEVINKEYETVRSLVS